MEMSSRHWWTKLMKGLKDEYDMFQKTVNANSQFSGFVSSPMSAAAHSMYYKK